MKEQDVAYVAVYGSLRKGMHNHGYLQKDMYIGEFQSDPIYDMYSVSGSYPALVPNGATSINMEVYSVSANTLKLLNALEGYEGAHNPDNHYNRTVINTPYGLAYLYLYNHGVSKMVQVESGDWVSFKNNIKFQTT